MRISTFNQFQRQAEMISMQYEKMTKLQKQIYTGKKLLNSSEDPVLASQIKSSTDFLNNLNSYSNNGALARGRGELYETTTKGALGVMSDIQNILQRVQTGTASEADKQTFIRQLQGDLTSLLNVANTQDANGSYIYSGSHTNTAPFTLGSSGYGYQGSYENTDIAIGLNVTSVFNQSGFRVFGNIYNGNGTFTVNAGSSNTGTGVASAGSVSSPTNYVADNYTITFGMNGSQLVYRVDGATSGQVVPAPPAIFPAGAPPFNPSAQGVDISFNGVTLNVQGTPADGDTFEIKPSTQQNAFDLIQNVIDTLKNPNANKTLAAQNLSQAVAAVSQITSHLTSYQSMLGNRNNSMNDQINATAQLVENQKIVLGNLENADIVQVFSSYQQQAVALQATQESYMKMQDLLTQLLKMSS